MSRIFTMTDKEMTSKLDDILYCLQMNVFFNPMQKEAMRTEARIYAITLMRRAAERKVRV